MKMWMTCVRDQYIVCALSGFILLSRNRWWKVWISFYIIVGFVKKVLKNESHKTHIEIIVIILSDFENQFNWRIFFFRIFWNISLFIVYRSCYLFWGKKVFTKRHVKFEWNCEMIFILHNKYKWNYAIWILSFWWRNYHWALISVRTWKLKIVYWSNSIPQFSVDNFEYVNKSEW